VIYNKEVMMSDFEVCPIGTVQRLAAVEAERDALRALIADDSFAAAFQTIYWYRSALLKSAREPT
jgi:hypothetical protein